MNDQQREMQRRLRVIKYVEKPGNQSWRQTTALIRRATTCRQLSTPVPIITSILPAAFSIKQTFINLKSHSFKS